MKGEFWIRDSEAVFADGDVGEQNHEAIVMDYAAELVADELDELGHDSWADIVRDWSGDPIGLRTALNDEVDRLQRSGSIDSSEDLTHMERFRKLGVTQHDDVLECLWRGSDFDTRRVAIKHFDWVYVRGNGIACHRITGDLLRRISRALSDEVDDDEETFMIESTATGEWFRRVPFRLFSDGDAGALRPFQTARSDVLDPAPV